MLRLRFSFIQVSCLEHTVVNNDSTAENFFLDTKLKVKQTPHGGRRGVREEISDGQTKRASDFSEALVGYVMSFRKFDVSDSFGLEEEFNTSEDF